MRAVTAAACLGLALLPAVAPAQGPVPVPADTLAAAGLDSLPARVDSLAAAPADSSLATAPPDSTPATPVARRAVPPWIRDPDLGPAAIAAGRPESLLELLEMLPGGWGRVAGDRGARPWLSTGPVSTGAPELLVDGIPSRSPADLQPAVWDRNAIGVRAVAIAPGSAGDRIELGSDPAVPGRSYLRDHFTSTVEESYLRGLSFTTPQAQRVLRVDYEEWKSELGFNFRLDPLADDGPLGKTKMRRFRVQWREQVEAGEAFLEFGRGHRLVRGTVLSPSPHEHWSGQLAAGLDREARAGQWRARLYHVGHNEVDRVHGGRRDGLRQGFSLAYRPDTTGPSLELVAERQAAAFSLGVEDSRHARGVASLQVGQRLARRALSLRWSAGADYAGTGGSWAPAGALGLDIPLRGELLGLALSAEESPRQPSLFEARGLWQVDYANGEAIVHRGGGDLGAERQGVARAGLDLRAGRFRAHAGVEHWWLREGIGWGAPVGGEATYTGGRRLDVDQAVAHAQLELGRPTRGLALAASGHRVLGSLARDGNRGAGWPVDGVQLGARAWTSVRRPHNILFVDWRLRRLGQRFDDMLAPFGGAQRPAIVVQDLRVGLRIRGAELYAAWDNLADVLREEVSGTRRRSRQMRLGLAWPLYD